MVRQPTHRKVVDEPPALLRVKGVRRVVAGHGLRFGARRGVVDHGGTMEGVGDGGVAMQGNPLDRDRGVPGMEVVMEGKGE